MRNVTLDVCLHVHDARWQTLVDHLEHWLHDIICLALERATADDNYELAVVCLNDAAMATYNAQYRGKNSPTNVLSFPSDDNDPAEDMVILGDILLSVDTIMREAEEQKKTVHDHLAHMVVHGVLHLLGYDHMDEGDAQTMEKAEREILAQKNIADPYAINAIL